MDLIIKHLSNEKSLALKPIMLLVAELAKDLRGELYPHFSLLFTSILILSKSGDVEIIETVFTSISFLFKCFMKQLLEDLQKTFLNYVTILTDEKLFEKSYIRRFVGQSFAFLVRKLEPEVVPQHIDFMFQYLADHRSDTMADGISILFFETVRGVQYRLNSKSNNFLHCVLEKSRESACKFDEERYQPILSMLEKLMLQIRRHIRKEFTYDLWRLMTDELKWVYKDSCDPRFSSTEQTYAQKILEITREWVSFRSGDCVIDADLVFSSLLPFLSAMKSRLSMLQKSSCNLLIDCLCELWRVADMSLGSTHFHSVCGLVYSGDVDEVSLDFSIACSRIERMQPILIGELLGFIGKNFEKQTSACLNLLSSVLPSLPGHMIECNPQLKRLQLDMPRLEVDLPSDLRNHLYCMQFVQIDSNVFLREFPDFFVQLKQLYEMKNIECLEQALLALHHVLLKVKEPVVPDFLATFFLDNVQTFRNEFKILAALCHFLPFIRAKTPEKLSTDILFQSIYPALASHLSSPMRDLRLVALRILASFDQLPFLKGTDEDDVLPPGPCNILALCLGSEEEPLTLECYRKKIIDLRKLETWSLTDRLPEIYVEVLIRYTLSWLSVKFSLLWETAIDVLVHQASKYPKLLWKFVWAQMLMSVKHGSSRNMLDSRTSFERFHYLRQLLKLLSRTPEVAERHSRDFCPLFIQYYRDFIKGNHKDVPNPQPSISEEEASESPLVFLDFNSKQVQELLIDFLEILKGFKNPKSLYRSDEILRILHELLLSNSAKIQELTLQALFTWNLASLNPYKEELQNFLSEKTFHDSLLKFSIDPPSGFVKTAHREILIPILIRLLVGKICQIRSSLDKSNSRKSAILSYLTGCTSTELALFFNLIRPPFILPTSKTTESIIESLLDLPAISIQKRHLHLVGLIATRMSSAVGPHLDQIMLPLICMAANAHRSLTMETQSPLSTHLVVPYKTIRHVAMTHLATLFLEPSYNDLYTYGELICETFYVSMLEGLPHETVLHVNSALDLLLVWSSRTEFFPLFEKFSIMLPSILRCFSSKRPHVETIRIIIQILYHLIHEHWMFNYWNQVIDSFRVFLIHSLAEDRLDKDIITEIIQLLAILSEKLEHGNTLSQIVDLLIPNLKRKGTEVPWRTKCEILKIFHRGARIFAKREYPEQGRTILRSPHYRLISFLFSRLKSQKMRLMCCEILSCLVEHLSDMKRVVELVTDLNSCLVDRIEEWDYARRSNAFVIYGESMVSLLDEDAQLPIFFNLIHFLNEPDELSIRQQASFAFRKFLEHLSSRQNDASWANIIEHMVLPAIKRGLHLKNDSVHSEYIRLLQYATKHLDLTAGDLRELRCLLHTEEEADFFGNYIHIQVHRRIRAMKRLGDVLSTNSLSEKAILNFVLPLVNRIVLFPDQNVDPNLYHEAVEVLGKLTRCLSWEAYSHVLSKIQSATKKATTNEHLLAKALIGILHEFHFDITGSVAIHEESIANPLVSNSEQAFSEISGTVDETFSTNSQSVIILRAVTQRILPNIYSLISKGSSGSRDSKLRLPLVIGILHLLRKLPENHFHLYFPKLTIIVCQSLKNREPDVRDRARETLIEMIRYLGLSHLESILGELRSHLNRGFERHILGFSLNFILKSICQTEKIEVLSLSCVREIWTILDDELFGTINEEKQEEQIKVKFKEMKAKKGLESLELLCTLIDLNGIHYLIGEFRRRWLASSEELSNACISASLEAQRRFSSGLIHNRFITLEELMTVCYSLAMEQLFNDTKKVNEKGIVKDETVSSVTGQFLIKHPFGDWPVGCSLLLVNGLLKRGSFRPSEKIHMGLLDPFVNIAINCIGSSHENVVAGGLKLLGRLMEFPLPSIMETSGSVYPWLFRLIRKAPSVRSPIAQNCIKLITLLLRHFKRFEVPEKQLRTLIMLLIPELEDTERQSTSFAFLKAMIHRRFRASEIFLAMDRVMALMVQSQLDGVREHARQTLFEYLMNFPIGKTRLDDCMVFLIKNLSYEYESGRLSVLEVIYSASLHFPERVLVKYAVELFLPLVWKISYDDSLVCRESAKKGLAALLERLPDKSLDPLIDLIQQWLHQDKMALKIAALSVIPFFVDLQKKSSTMATSYLRDLIINIHKLLNNSTNPKILCLGLDALSPLIDPAMSEQDSFVQLCSRLPSFLLSEDRSSQLASLMFIQNLLRRSSEDGSDLSLRWLISLERPMKLAESLFKFVQVNMNDEEPSLVAMKALAHLGKLFYSHSQLFEDDSTIGPQEHDFDYEADPMGLTINSTIQKVRQQYIHLTNLFKYIIKAIKKENLDRTALLLCAFRWFASMVSLLTPQHLEAYLFYIIFVLRRVLETTASEVSNSNKGKNIFPYIDLDFSLIYHSDYVSSFVHFKIL